MAYTRVNWLDLPNTSTPVDAANLNIMDAGIAAADTTASGAVPKSVVTATGDLIVGTGNAAVGRLGIGSSGQVLHGGTTPAWSAIALGDLPAGTAGQVLGGTGPSYALPPGYTIAYVEFTSPVTANNVAEASATQIVTAGAITFDGTAVDIEFSCPALTIGGTLTGGINLWDVTTDQGRLFDGSTVSTVATDYPCKIGRRVTPSAGSHTYNIRIWTTTVNNFIAEAGAGGAGTKLPGYIKITKA